MGNCWEAAIASVLEIPLEEVMDERDESHPRWAPGTWQKDWFETWAQHWNLKRDWLKEVHGKDLVPGEGEAPPPEMLPPDGFWLAVGPARRGCLHCVVFQGAEMVHDPHPDRTGLLAVTEWEVLL